MYSNKIVLVILSLLISSNMILAQTSSLRIEVKKEGDALRIPNVKVSIFKDGVHFTNTVTNKYGIADLDSLEYGQYKIDATLTGFAVKGTQSVVVSENKQYKVKLIMTATSIPITSVEEKPLEPNGVTVVVEEDLVEAESMDVDYSLEIREVRKAESKKGKHKNRVQYMSLPSSDATSYGYLGVGSINQSVGNLSFNSYQENLGTETYKSIEENKIIKTSDENTSTFSIDVDVASYANMRRFINSGQLPPQGAVRLEEMINYFDYNYPFKEQDEKDVPFSFHTEMATAPWNSKKQLVHIGIKGKELELGQAPPNNLVYLIDVSGSMSSLNKLGLVKQSLNMLADNLRPNDYISLVVYAGSSGLVLKPTSCANPNKIKDAINRLSSGGSTAGGAGIQLAYKTAEEHFIENGNNRVILCTDGDFNVGVSSEEGLIKLIEEKRKSGVFLSVLGFGTGNYQDQKMEQLADHGNGNYAYIDRIEEARKVLIDEMMGTLSTIAKDVKIQVEFDSTLVKNYRLVGYENRVLENKDFEDDTKDAGEIGAGHTVTAMYEIELQDHAKKNDVEIMDLRIRYKDPKAETSQLLSHKVKSNLQNISEASENLRFSTSVAAFGMKLRNSGYVEKYKAEEIITLAKGAIGSDEKKYRAEFLELVKRANTMGLIAAK
ncbi:MAG: von Willebrand factor type A domain-containing protein [Flavobacteriales bacterium]|nr:von Willebrand factor type A domain-containing protein [Flavobacteriales bacterium]